MNWVATDLLSDPVWPSSLEVRLDFSSVQSLSTAVTVLPFWKVSGLEAKVLALTFTCPYDIPGIFASGFPSLLCGPWTRINETGLWNDSRGTAKKEVASSPFGPTRMEGATETWTQPSIKEKAHH